MINENIEGHCFRLGPCARLGKDQIKPDGVIHAYTTLSNETKTEV